MKIGDLLSALESLDQNAELVVELTKEDGETITTYDIGFGYSELGAFALQIHE